MSSRPTPLLLLVRELGIGGCERDLSRIARGLDRSRFEVHVGCFHTEGIRTEEIRQASLPIVRFPLTSFGNLSFPKAVLRLREYVAEHRIELVHSFDAPMNCFATGLGLFRTRPRLVFSHLWHRRLILGKAQRMLLRIGDSVADACITNSFAVRRELVETYRVPEERIFVCHNGVDLGDFHPGVRFSRPVERHPLVIGTVCALRPEKRVDLVMEAFREIAKDNPDVCLRVVGEGPERGALERLGETLGIRDRCELVGLRSNIPEELGKIDIFVLASDSESFPNALLEAMACGCACVGANVGGVPELIQDGVNGLLFRPGDRVELSRQLQKLCQDASLRAKLAVAAARTAQESFSSSHHVAAVSAVYNRVLG